MVSGTHFEPMSRVYIAHALRELAGLPPIPAAV